MKTSEPKVKFFDGEDFTCVTFQPDLSKFKMEKLDRDIVALLTRRAYDVAGSCKGVKVSLNGKKLPVSLSLSPHHTSVSFFLVVLFVVRFTFRVGERLEPVVLIFLLYWFYFSLFTLLVLVFSMCSQFKSLLLDIR